MSDDGTGQAIQTPEQDDLDQIKGHSIFLAPSGDIHVHQGDASMEQRPQGIDVPAAQKPVQQGDASMEARPAGQGITVPAAPNASQLPTDTRQAITLPQQTPLAPTGQTEARAKIDARTAEQNKINGMDYGTKRQEEQGNFDLQKGSPTDRLMDHAKTIKNPFLRKLAEFGTGALKVGAGIEGVLAPEAPGSGVHQNIEAHRMVDSATEQQLKTAQAGAAGEKAGDFEQAKGPDDKPLFWPDHSPVMLDKHSGQRVPQGQAPAPAAAPAQNTSRPAPQQTPVQQMGGGPMPQATPQNQAIDVNPYAPSVPAKETHTEQGDANRLAELNQLAGTRALTKDEKQEQGTLQGAQRIAHPEKTPVADKAPDYATRVASAINGTDLSAGAYHVDKDTPFEVAEKTVADANRDATVVKSAKKTADAEKYRADKDAQTERDKLKGNLYYVDNKGKQVAGTLADLKKAGFTEDDIVKVGEAEKEKIINARTVMNQFDKKGTNAADMGIMQLTQKLSDEGKLGILIDRWNDLAAHKIGAGVDPEVMALFNKLNLQATAIMQVHFGASGGRSPALLEHFQEMADATKMDGPTLLAGLKAERSYISDKSMRIGEAASTGTPHAALVKKYGG